jgi:CMP-N,N'-diacetyllegionaminic acid synthase
MLIYAIVPARSGSVGIRDKNIKKIARKPLIAYSIEFAKKLNVDRVFCSTDSEVYAEIAKSYGAEVPFLRSEFASTSTAMEQDILLDLYGKFKSHNIPQPDLIVWLRPTFVFRNVKDVRSCIKLLLENPNYTAARTVCESESRLYSIKSGQLIPSFDDEGKSMIRRQDVGTRYKVFSTDIIRSKDENTGVDFLGNNVAAIATNKLCGLDIDDEMDFKIVESILENNKKLIDENT